MQSMLGQSVTIRMQSLGRRSGHVFERACRRRRNSSSLVPQPQHVERHVALLRKHTESSTLPVKPLLSLNKNRQDIRAALKGLEAVVGISADEVCEMLSYAPPDTIEEWTRRLLTWKDIRRGRDLFIPGHGSYDVMFHYDEQVSRNRKVFAVELLNVIKAPSIRKECKVLAVHDSDKKRPSVVDLRNLLASSLKLDLFELMGKGVFKKAGFATTLPRFRMFVDWYELDAYGHTLQVINRDTLWRCVCSGGFALRPTVTSPFWLVTVQELQTLSYFANAITNDTNGRSAFNNLNYIMSQNESCPQRQHLLRYREYYMNPDHIGSLDVIAGTILRSYGWPEGGASMVPKRLLEEIEIHEYGPDVKLDHLDQLPDKGRLRVLRSAHAIHRVGKALRNCADMYIERAVQKKGLFVVLENENGKEVALGWYRLEKPWSGWAEICKARNQSPSQEIIDSFAKYSDTIEDWCSTWVHL